ncbi:hypothetical protein AALO_G00176670, partial [Alosa alosa]
MVEAIPGLINAIRMIHSISRYYNTSEKITSLFVKVTNQMITACKTYITNNGSVSIWDQPQELVTQRIKAAIHLNQQEYQRYFHKTKQALEKSPSERQFDFSEMYIFGKFDTFQRRLNKILNMFDIINTYSALQDSKIEGLETMATKFQAIVLAMKKKPYSFLDQRRTDFDQDYDEFCKHTNELHNQLRAFMDTTLDKIQNTERALSVLKKFERLGIPDLGISEKYQRLLQNFGRDIEMVSRIYMRQKLDPPMGRDLPPVAGCIQWVRQLFRRIQSPMETFQKQPGVLDGPEAKRIIRNYNRMARVLLEYELLYHRGWMDQIEVTKVGLQASLLVKCPDTGELYVNFDPQILTQIREKDCMTRMGLEIPPFAAVLQQKQHVLKRHYNQLQLVLTENRRVRGKIQSAFEQLLSPHVARVDEAILPGLTTLNWTSLNIDKYINHITAALEELELLLDRVNDLVEFRIDAVLQDMSCTPLCVLPDEEPFTCDEFVQKTRELCMSGAQTLHTKSALVEEAANELINMLLESEQQQEPPQKLPEPESRAESKTEPSDSKADPADSEGED